MVRTFFWQDGTVCKAINGLCLSAQDRGATLGDALFETFPIFGGKALWAKEHLDRLDAGCAVLRLKADRTICEKIIAHAEKEAANSPAILRLQVSRGVGQRGLHFPEPQTPFYMASLSPWSETMLKGSVRLGISPIRRNESSPVSQLKSANYLDNILALEGEKARGFDDTLMLNTQGNLACTTTGNIFFIKGRKLFTPSIDCGVLSGIVRQKLMKLASFSGLSPQEGIYNLEDIKSADVAFITNSARFMIPISHIEGEAFLNAEENGFFLALRKALSQEVKHTTGFDLPWSAL